MPATTPQLPEGSDTIIAGASATEADDAFMPELDDATGLDADVDDDADDLDDRTGEPADVVSAAKGLREQAGEHTAEWREQAGDKARDYATQGKDRATAALEGVSRMIGDAATQVDDKVGAEYGDYARRAQAAIDGVAGALRDKDVDQLFAEGRELVRRSPGIAIGTAAVLGFALVRLVKAGLPQPQPELAAAPEGAPKGKRDTKAKRAA